MENSQPPKPAGWAEPLARAWHRSGTNWPQVEQRLITEAGLSDNEAHALVIKIIKEELLPPQPVASEDDIPRFVRLPLTIIFCLLVLIYIFYRVFRLVFIRMVLG